MALGIHIQPFFDPKTWTVSYVVTDTATNKAAVIDPVLDFDFKSGRNSTAHARVLAMQIRKEPNFSAVAWGGIDIQGFERWMQDYSAAG